MRTIIGMFVLALAMSVACNVFAQPAFEEGRVAESTSEPKGVYCEVNGVKLMAKTAADCEKAGGTVTHVISTTVTPAGEAMDNPEEEPEIQRDKDKEPEAP